MSTEAKPRSFAIRFRNVALTYGLPLWVVDVLTSSNRGIASALVHLPFAVLGALVYTVLEGWVGDWCREHKIGCFRCAAHRLHLDMTPLERLLYGNLGHG